MGHFKSYEEFLDKKRFAESIGASLPQEMIEEGERLRQEAESLSETPIYATFQRSAKFPYSEELKQCIEETVDALLGGGMNAREPVLLLGNVQCGKTNTFENVMALAMDRGIDVCIVLTKGTKALVEQTIERAKHDFREFKENGKLGETIIEVLDAIKMQHLTQAQVSDKHRKYIIVCKKQMDNLENMIQMFRKAYMRDVRLLVVDDEADFASRNYQVTHSHGLGTQDRYLELARIAEKIEELINAPRYCRYLQVTATPYSMLLQPDGTIDLRDGKASSFKPRFISEVPVHSKYVGGKQYYEDSQYDDSMYSHIYCETSDKAILILKKPHGSYIGHGVRSENAADIVKFVLTYLAATAVRVIQSAKKGNKYNSSAMLHCSTQKDMMSWQSNLLHHYIAEVKLAFQAGEEFVDKHVTLGQYWNDIYSDLCESAKKGVAQGLLDADHYFPTKSEVYGEVRSMLENAEVNIQIVNSDNDVSALLNSSGQLKLSHKANLFIGGFNLDRGVTIDHLLCVFYGRNPGTVQQNTVLQHARWYGSRSMEDMAVTRFFTSREIQEILIKVNDLDRQMRVWLRAMKNSDNQTNMPYFVGYDKGIKPCASQQIIPSNTFTINGHKRLLPIGFQTMTKGFLESSRAIEQIESLLKSVEGYKKDECFVIDFDLASKILDLIYFSFDTVNAGCDKDILLAVLAYTTGQSNGKLYCVHRTDREMSRLTRDGRYITAPDDGRTDIPYAKSMAVDMPVLTLLGQKGRVEDGWRGHPFYWPVLMTQENLTSAIFTFGASFDWGDIDIVDNSKLIGDIPRETILELGINLRDFREYMEQTSESGEIADEELKVRSVHINDSGFAKYLRIDPETNKRMLIPEVKESDLQAGLFSYNEGTFPFVARDYDYILFTAGSRNYLKGWLLVKLNGYDVEADDCDPEEDTLIDDDGKRMDYVDEDMATWCINYRIEKTVGWIRYDEAGNEELKKF